MTNEMAIIDSVIVGGGTAMLFVLRSLFKRIGNLEISVTACENRAKLELEKHVETKVTLAEVQTTLKFLERRSDRIQKSSPTAIFTVDLTGTILSVSDSILEVTGHSPDELIGEKLTNIIPDSLHESHKQAFNVRAADPNLKEGEPFTATVNMFNASGHPIQCKIVVLETKEGESKIFYGLMTRLYGRASAT